MPSASAVSIVNITTGYNITAQNYSAIVNDNGVMIDLYINGSVWDLLGDDFQYGLNGIYLEKDEIIVIPDNDVNASTTLKFINTSIGNWTYEFYEDNFSVIVNLTSSSGDVSFFATPDIDYMLMINETGTTNSEDLSEGIGNAYLWKNVTYTTFENALFSMYLDSHSIAGDYGKTFYDDIQIWGLYGDSDCDPMKQGGDYHIVFKLDASSFTPKQDTVTIDETVNGFNISTTNFTATITEGGIMDNLIISGSIWDMLGDDIQPKLDGIYLANSSGEENIINAINYNISDNRIFFNSSVGTWIYKFDNNGFRVVIRLSDSSGDIDFLVVPDIDHMIRINETGTANSENLIDGIGANYNWKNATYTTIENILFSMYLQNDPVGSATGTTVFSNSQQIWGLHALYEEANPMTSGGEYHIVFELNASNFAQKNDAVNITKISGGYNITATNFTAIITEEGIMRDLYAAGSYMDILGNYFSSGFDGIYLANNSNSVIINATCNITSGNKIKFCSSKVNWTYRFDANKFDVFVKTAPDSGDIDFYAAPDISHCLMINQTGSSAYYEDLYDEIGANYIWRNVTFTTTENVLFDMHLNAYRGVEAKAITEFQNNVQYWAINDQTSMKQKSEYSILFNIDTTQIDIYHDIINITPVSGGYNISSQMFYYYAFVTDKGILTDLFFQKGPNDFLDNNQSVNANDGIYITEDDDITTINATSSVFAGNSIFFNSSIGTWRYDFSNKQFKLTVKTNSNSGDIDLWMIPNPEIVSIAFDRENSTNTINLSNGCSCNDTFNKEWSEAGYKTIFGDWITAYLYNHPIGTTDSQLGCCKGNNIEHWAYGIPHC